MNARRLCASLLAVIVVIAAACACSAPRTTLTVYSPSGLGSWYKARFDEFTSQTGIGVTLFEAGSGEVVSRVNSPEVWRQLDTEGSVPPADLLVTLPPFIQKAAKAGLLQPSGADATGIPPSEVGADGVFVPIARTALCFIANPGADPAPATWNDLLRPDLKGKLQYSTPGEAGDGTAMLILLQHLMGKPAALDFFAKLQTNNVGPAKSTGKLQPKVDSGELLVANGDVQMNLASIANDGSKFGIFFPAMPDNSRTTISLFYGAGVTAQSRQPEAAKKLLAFLLSDAAQRSVFTEAFGIPVRDTVTAQMIAENAGRVTPTSLLEDVTLWAPDWNVVLAELDADIEAYTKATAG